jgi:hypothetical protein
MFHDSRFAAMAACVLLLTVAASAADRGPSTPEERKQILDHIHAWQAAPLSSQAKDHAADVLKWLADVPDLTVHVCTILDKLPKGDKKDASTIFGGQFMAQAAFVIENPEKSADRLAELQAGLEGALRTYEFLLSTNPKDRQPFLDDLIQLRDAGTLSQYVKERAAASCKN